MPLPADIWTWGPWIGLLIAVVLLALPVILSRMANRDKIDQERRDRADKTDQERRDKADQERREQAALLLQHLQTTATNAQRKLDEQGAEFLKALERRDTRDERIIEALRGLTATIDSLQRRQQR